jgi:carboxyl-terminal processing protease
MTFRTRLAVLLVSTPLVAFAVVGGLMGKTVARDDSYRNLRTFEDVVSLVLNNYVEEVDIDRVMDGAMRGLADGLDAESSFLSSAEVTAIERGEAPPPGDTGLDLTRQYYLRVVAARDGSPAARAGIDTGDYIRAIDGASTRDMSIFEGRRRLRGEVGSTVTLTVLRGSAAEPHQVALTRETIPSRVTAARMLADGIGLVRVETFGSGVAASLASEVATLQQSGARALVVDVRGTTGGDIESGLEAARLFLSDVPLARRESRARPPEIVTAPKNERAIDLPVALLVTTGTAGAGELFAAALAGNGRAALVGEQTLGRAGVQKLVRLPDGSGLWMTWARFLAPDGTAIHGAGLEPTIAASTPDVEFGAERPAIDPILDAALGHLRTPSAR